MGPVRVVGWYGELPEGVLTDPGEAVDGELALPAGERDCLAVGAERLTVLFGGVVGRVRLGDIVSLTID